MKISKKLCLLRVKQGLSYGRLGQLAHIAPSTYLQWEHDVEPTALKFLPVLELFSDLYGTEISESDMRNEDIALKFDESGNPFFAPETEDIPEKTSQTSVESPARVETILEYEGLYSRLRVSEKLTEKEAQMLIYLVKGFLNDKDGSPDK